MFRSFRYCAFYLGLFLSSTFLFAAEPQQVVFWPDAQHPMLRISFGKFKDMGGSVGSQRPFAIDTVAENTSTHLITNKQLLIYVFDKKKIRLAEGSIAITNLAPGQSARFQTTIMASGSPAFIEVADQPVSERTISLTVNSVPQGATLQVDGKDVGMTPKLIELGPGKHRLSFHKDGFRHGVFPIEISDHDVSGGSVSYELGAVQFDTIELRDGTVFSGDLDSVQGMEVILRIGGTLQRFSRNQVKRILLVEREAPEPSSLPLPETK